MTLSILKIVLVLVLLAGMIILLVTVNHFFAGGFDSDNNDIDELRRNIKDKDEVISDQNVFRNLVKDPVRIDEDPIDKFFH